MFSICMQNSCNAIGVWLHEQHLKNEQGLKCANIDKADCRGLVFGLWKFHFLLVILNSYFIGLLEKTFRTNPGLEVIIFFSYSTQLNKKFQLLVNTKIPTNKEVFFASGLSDIVFIMLINVKMPTLVGILTFMSRMYFMLSWVEPEKSFITSGPGSSFKEGTDI